MSYLWRSYTPANKKVERLITQGFDLIVCGGKLGGDCASSAHLLILIN